MHPKNEKIPKFRTLFHFQTFCLHLSLHCLYSKRTESNLHLANNYSTNPTAPACITYSQPPPSAGSYAGDTIFSYSCGPTQATHAWLATATNAPASAATHTPVSISHLPTWAYICIGVGGLIVLALISSIIKKLVQPNTSIWVCTQPSHPAISPYQCRHCGSRYLKYDTVKPGNPNGNFGRPYYVCVNPSCPNVMRPDRRQHFRGWVTWDDSRGVDISNPLCECQRSARLDTAGVGSDVPGRRYWTCSTGACGYTSWRPDGSLGWGNGV